MIQTYFFKNSHLFIPIKAFLSQSVLFFPNQNAYVSYCQKVNLLTVTATQETDIGGILWH
jgi:hypothetical protein